MKNKISNKKGFTLIELLVVVLIIGILASIALPQYQKAVDKSKAMEAVVQGRALLNAQKLHYTQTGSWSSDLEVLDVTAPDWTCHVGSAYCNKSGSVAGATFEIARYLTNRIFFFCKADAENERANQLCVAVGGKYHHTASNRKYYNVFDQRL